jgi:hypothetical protein
MLSMDATAMWGLIGSLLGAAVGGAATIWATRMAMNATEKNRLQTAERERTQTLKGLQLTLGMAATDNNITIAARGLRHFLLNNSDLLERSKNLQEFYGAWLVEIDEVVWPAPGYWRSTPSNESREWKMKKDLHLLDG